jgi:hypothetical protein
MKKTLRRRQELLKILPSHKTLTTMRNILILMFLTTFQVFADNTYAQNTTLSMDLKKATIKSILHEIENNSEFYFLYNSKLIDDHQLVDVQFEEQNIEQILARVFAETDIEYIVVDRQIILSPPGFLSDMKVKLQPRTITGEVRDENGEPLPGVNVLIKGTTLGAITTPSGKYSLPDVPDDAILVFSFLGMLTQEIPVGDKTAINVILQEGIYGIEKLLPSDTGR